MKTFVSAGSASPLWPFTFAGSASPPWRIYQRQLALPQARGVAGRSGRAIRRILLFALLLLGSPARAAEAPKPPGNWTCDAALYGDGVCDCGCGVKDTDCGAGTFTVCERHACPEGRAPWEHEPWKCMTSVCGDGWRDERAGEVCDDGNALASGGCSADCKSISPGYICGDRAEKCAPDPSVEPGPESAETSPESNEAVATGGCASAGSPLLWPFAALVLFVRRRRSELV